MKTLVSRSRGVGAVLLMNAFLLPASLTAANPATTFKPPANYPSGVWPEAVAMGQFNSDTYPDLAVANWSSGTVSIFLGSASGTFTKLSPDISVGVQPRSIAVGDFNKDSKQDLAVANQGGGVTILLGNGNGTFQAPSKLSAGIIPYYVAAGDFNKDGYSDLAVVNDNVGVTILLGSSTGLHVVHNYTSVFPSSVAVADIDNDGNLDLVFANPTKSNVSVMLGNGNGTFGAPKIASTGLGSEPFGIATGDFNGDTYPDVVATDYTGNVDVLLWNNSTKTLQPVVNYPVGLVPTSVAVGDLNGDNVLDLVVTNSYSNSISVFLGDGTGAFSRQADYSGAGLPLSIVMGDFNNDGVSDVAFANFYGSISVLLGTDIMYTVTASPSSEMQMTKVNTAFPKPLVVNVKVGASPAHGVPVIFSAPATGASGTFGGFTTVTVLTDASGNATVPLTADATPGTYTITATAAFGRPGTTVTFTETNTM